MFLRAAEKVLFLDLAIIQENQQYVQPQALCRKDVFWTGGSLRLGDSTAHELASLNSQERSGTGAYLAHSVLVSSVEC